MSKEASKRNPFYDIDIFGQSIPLRFQQRAEYNTKCGVIYFKPSFILYFYYSYHYITLSNSSSFDIYNYQLDLY